MWIVCQADESHEISRHIFYEKKKKKKPKKKKKTKKKLNVVCYKFCLAL